jgi:penicillin-binding protein 1A
MTKTIQRKWTTWPRLFGLFFICLILLFVIAGIYIAFLSKDLPPLEKLENFDPDLVTRVYSDDGIMLKELYTQRRIFLPLEQMRSFDPSIGRYYSDLVNAVVASEDHRFYDHWGISMRDFLRAVVVNLAAMRYKQGFSSLSQQLARNLYDRIGFSKTINRKVKEILTAVQMEKRYTKDEIMEMYLNSIYFGHGTFGAQAAAKRYFAKDVRNLTLDESALLVGLLPAPEHYSPVKHPKVALRRRNTVLRLMLNQGKISRKRYESAKSASLNVVDLTDDRGIAPYFTEHVRRQLEQISDSLDIDIYRDGLTVYTTLDTRMQKAAEVAMLSTVLANQEKLNEQFIEERELFEELAWLGIHPEDSVKLMLAGEKPLYEELRKKLLVQGSLVAVDPSSGYIKAMVGGRPDYHDDFNRSTQARRQPGSVFKPFLYTAAIDNGYPVTKKLMNQPIMINVMDANGEWKRWRPRNDDRSVGDRVTLREGLTRSLNLISVRLVQELIPPREVVDMAKRMHISTPLRAVDAIALGTSEVYPIEMVSAYATFANGGIYCEPMSITRIDDRYGITIAQFYPKREEVLSEETAFMMSSLLQSVIKKGTGRRVGWWKGGFNRPAGGKTGTTQNWTDAWFVGFTPHLATGVWMGVDGPPQISLGDGQMGNVAALPAWVEFMQATYDTLSLPYAEFKKPDGIVQLGICQITKDLVTPNCPVEKEYFINKYSPSGICQLHSKTNPNSSRRRSDFD